MKTISSLAILFLILFVNQRGFAQQLEWIYEYDTQESSEAFSLWIDHDQNIFTNYRTRRKDNSYRTEGLIKLDQNGKFKGIIQANGCNNTTYYLPFGEKEYLVSGQYCFQNKSMVFDQFGSLINEGPGLKGNFFARYQNQNGYFFFSKPRNSSGDSYLNIGHTNWKFDYTQDSISLNHLERENLHLINNYVEPVNPNKDEWFVPFNYGEKNGPGIGVDHGLIVGIKENKVNWSYPDTLSKFPVAHLAEKNGIVMAIFDSKSYRPNLVVFLDRDGNEINNYSFRYRSKIDELILNEHQFIILSKGNLSFYNLDGELIRKISISNEFGIDGTEVIQTDTNEFLIAGKRYGKAMVAKLTIDPELSSENIDENLVTNNTLDSEEVDTALIQSASFDHLSPEVLSVSAFPNPTALYIHFEMQDKALNSAKFNISIFNVSGILLHEDDFQGTEYELNVQNFTAGTYFYRIIAKTESQMVSGSFIKI